MLYCFFDYLNNYWLSEIHSITVNRFADDSGDCVLEVDSGSFRWKGWMPKKDDNGETSKVEEEARNGLQNPDYDVVEQPFILDDVNLRVQKASVLLISSLLFGCIGSLEVEQRPKFARRDFKVFKISLEEA